MNGSSTLKRSAMIEEIRFSIVIPAYNAASTIVASVESCLSQSYPTHEVIVVDDGSTDGTAGLLEARFGLTIQLISLPENGGPAAARNAGIRAATGTHIAFQDADDVWHRSKLAHIADILHDHPHIRFLFHPYTLSDGDFSADPQMLRPASYPFWKLLLSNPIGTPCVVTARGITEPFNEQLRYMEDYELFLRLAYRQGLYRISAPFTRLGRPILSSGGQSSRRWSMRRGEIRAWWSFAKSHPLFFPLLVPLVLLALAKHAVKSFFPPRTNY
jgi:glycosyltransferase involved in cell wall biosynthesis